jgi:hypothetical protein
MGFAELFHGRSTKQARALPSRHTESPEAGIALVEEALRQRTGRPARRSRST